MPPLLLLRDAMRNKLLNFKEGRARRRRKMNAFIARWIPTFRLSLLVIGYLWFFVLPSPHIGRNVYIDENALQPSQVTTYWGWGEVHRADRYLDELERLRDTNASSELRAEYIAAEFAKLGLPSATQKYSFQSHGEVLNGMNAYSVFAAPRTSGTEAMVISASWRSVTDGGKGSLNLRGVATVLSLASFLKRYSHWAKDIVFVVGDGYLDGMHAWLSMYNDAPQSNLEAGSLVHSSGVIWTALNIDYPGHSFSHLGIFHEGLNGRLPNQDLINSFRLIAEHTGGVPVVLYDHLDIQNPKNRNWLSRALQRLPKFIRSQSEVVEYLTRARNIARQMKYQALGKGSGVHGLFHRYRIDAITIFGVPAEGPHGFHSIGRVVESTLRTMNNLLERLHASFFFYLLTTPRTFLKIGLYLPAPLMISISLLFGGLQAWVQAGWRQVLRDNDVKEKEESNSRASSGPVAEWETRPRPVIEALSIIILTHALGAGTFVLIDKTQYIKWGNSWERTALTITMQTAIVYSLARFTKSILTSRKSPESDIALISLVLKSFNMCFASALISVTSVLNFSFSAFLAVILGIPLTLTPSLIPTSQLKRVALLATYVAVASGCFVLINYAEPESSMWYWSVLGVWFTPLMYAIYIPLVYQAFVACLLAP